MSFPIPVLKDRFPKACYLLWAFPHNGAVKGHIDRNLNLKSDELGNNYWILFQYSASWDILQFIYFELCMGRLLISDWCFQDIISNTSLACISVLTPPIIPYRVKMAGKGDRKALFRVFWNNINQQMIDDQTCSRWII